MTHIYLFDVDGTLTQPRQPIAPVFGRQQQSGTGCKRRGLAVLCRHSLAVYDVCTNVRYFLPFPASQLASHNGSVVRNSKSPGGGPAPGEFACKLLAFSLPPSDKNPIGQTAAQ